MLVASPPGVCWPGYPYSAPSCASHPCPDLSPSTSPGQQRASASLLSLPPTPGISQRISSRFPISYLVFLSRFPPSLGRPGLDRLLPSISTPASLSEGRAGKAMPDIPGFWAGPRRPCSARKAGGTLRGHSEGGDTAVPTCRGAPGSPAPTAPLEGRRPLPRFGGPLVRVCRVPPRRPHVGGGTYLSPAGGRRGSRRPAARAGRAATGAWRGGGERAGGWATGPAAFMGPLRARAADQPMGAGAAPRTAPVPAAPRCRPPPPPDPRTAPASLPPGPPGPRNPRPREDRRSVRGVLRSAPRPAAVLWKAPSKLFFWKRWQKGRREGRKAEAVRAEGTELLGFLFFVLN